ncbi:hypothetical protein ABW41_15200 [Stenotrophomonas maltophilia]|nr:hypothetical protein ABW41_15200 [Stenotrophomonas maltophilia]
MIEIIFRRAEPCSAQRLRVQQPSMGPALQPEPVLVLDLLIFFRGWHAQETVRGRSGWAAQDRGAMDGAIEPHG